MMTDEEIDYHASGICTSGECNIGRKAMADFCRTRQKQINELLDENEKIHFDRLKMAAEIGELKEKLDLANRRLGELAHAPRTTGECSGCLELGRRLAVYQEGMPSRHDFEHADITVGGGKNAERIHVWLQRIIAALDEKGEK